VLPPEQRRGRTLAALIAQVEALARQRPVLMIFEDAHWSDPTSLEAFGRTIDRIAKLRVLLVITFRPEYAPPWIGQPQVTALTLNRLAVGETGTLIDRIAGNHALPAGVRQDIVQRTDGIPLFVEEMTKAVLEAGGERAARDAAGSVPPTALAVPASLHASLTARLDRLGAAKRVAQIGAAIGREFSHALLAAVVGEPEAELGAALPTSSSAGSRRSPNASRSCSRGIAPRRASSRRPRTCGESRGSSRWSARRWSKPSSRSRVHSP
jgi:predicted ATPase